MSELIRFLNNLQDWLNVSSEEFSDFLFIDKRTFYNYKNLAIDQLPNKVKEKVLIFFQGFEPFFHDNLTMEDIHRQLPQIDGNTLAEIRSRFLSIAQIRKKTYVVVSTPELRKQAERRTVRNLDEFLEDIRILMEYSQLSKGYLYSIFEIIIAKVSSENDYPFLDYLSKYQKGNRP